MKTKPKSITLDETTIKAVEKIAARQDRSFSYMVDWLLKNHPLVKAELEKLKNKP